MPDAPVLGSVSAGDEELVINHVENGQVQKSPCRADTPVSSACAPLPPPCNTPSACLSPELLLYPECHLPPAGSVQSSLPRFCFGAGISIFGEQYHQSSWDVLGTDPQ